MMKLMTTVMIAGILTAVTLLTGCTRSIPSPGVIDVASASGHIVTIEPEYVPSLSGDF